VQKESLQFEKTAQIAQFLICENNFPSQFFSGTQTKTDDSGPAPAEKQFKNQFAEAGGFDSVCSGSSGTENSRGGSVDRERGGPKRKRATTPRAIPIAARRASWPSRLFLSMLRIC
jgi:hypothetical protein